jgi:hypothetical protein
VLFWPLRDANPFFHFYEGLWMLGGRNDVPSLVRFIKRMAQFSSNGTTFHGAYGYRWRVHFGFNQLYTIGAALATNHDDRRQVLQIWDCTVDLRDQDNKPDIPCNLTIHFQVVGGNLNMTVFCRSNDIIWGCYGANAVHFSMLQEFMAALVGVPVGRYWHISDNWHAYLDTFTPLIPLADQRCMPPDQPRNPYEGDAAWYPMINTPINVWLGDLTMFLDEGIHAMGYRDPFFRHVALPMMQAHRFFKEKDSSRALDSAAQIKAPDWRRAVTEWLTRRRDKCQPIE